MGKPKVFITRRIPEKGLNLLAEECEVVVNPEDRPLSKEEIIKGMEDAQGLIPLLSDPIDAEVIESNPQLKVISNYAVGYNNIDVEVATEKGIMVTNTPGILTETTADLTFALLMAAARRIVESDKFTRVGKFSGWAPELMLGTDLHGKTLGIIGFGRIGQAVARRARGFEMKVIYNKRNPLSSEEEQELNAEYRDFEGLIKEADFITINAPLNDSTYHLFNKDVFKWMKDSAILINAGRGPIIDETALVEALESGEIAGAGLDVYEEEPEVNPGLVKLDNVVLTPHTGTGTVETRDKMAVMAAENLTAGLKGNRPPNIVNSEVFN